VAFLLTFVVNTTSSADLNRKLLTAGVTDKLAGLLLNVLGGTGRLIDSLADLFSLPVALLDNRLVTLVDSLIEGLLLEGDLTGLLKVLLTYLLLGRLELGDIGVVALLGVLVGALQDRVLLEGLNSLLLLYTAQAGVSVLHTAGEVNASLDGSRLLSSSSGQLVVVADKVS